MSTAADDNPAQDALIAQLAAFRESTEVETLEACLKLREQSANDTSARLRMERISSAAIISNFLEVGPLCRRFFRTVKIGQLTF
jgi:hypothetical protein